jgi:hypothetical protein
MCVMRLSQRRNTETTKRTEMFPSIMTIAPGCGMDQSVKSIWSDSRLIVFFLSNSSGSSAECEADGGGRASKGQQEQCFARRQ